MKKIYATLTIAFALFQVVYAQKWNDNWPRIREFQGKNTLEISMPLGGIGTGTVGIGGRGELKDWEIMNRGALGFKPAYRFIVPGVALGPFFAIRYQQENEKPFVRALEGPSNPRFASGDWGGDNINSGLPRFDEAVFTAAYPFAQVNFTHKKELPFDVRLEAFNPMIPGDEENSSIPVAILRYVVTNKTNQPLDISLVGMIPNFIGDDGWSGSFQGNYNEYKETKDIAGLYMFSKGLPKDDINNGTMALTVIKNGDISYRTSWAEMEWGWNLREFYDDIQSDGVLTEHKKNSGKIKTPPATLAVKNVLQPKETKEFTFMISWHFPNRSSWERALPASWNHGNGIRIGNYYTTKYTDAWDVALKTTPKIKDLEQKTINFVSALVDSDIPDVLIEAGLSNSAILRSQTLFVNEVGQPFGWEGTGSLKGTVPGEEKCGGWGYGSCTHVWNYENTIPFLYGDLSKRFREIEFKYMTKPNGAQSFRVNMPLETRGTERKGEAADGQMGTILKVYREWNMSGDDEMLMRLWPNIKKSLAFAWTGYWDKNKDGVMEGSQHNTADVNYEGPNPQIATWYLAALKAGEKMANHVGDKKFAKECSSLFESGSKWVDANLFNGEFYEHHITPGKSKVAQIGKGCLIDQLVGQTASHTAGLGYLLNKNNISSTLKSIMKYNYIDNFNDHFNSFRTYAIGGESGLRVVSYPIEGTLLDRPTPYYAESWTGVEYCVGSHMLYEGHTEDGLKVFENVRNRYDGYKRNPFNEGEYGHRYARAMAAWGGILAYTGFEYSAVEKSMKFKNQNGKFFWSNGYQYGTVEISDLENKKKVHLTVLKGELELKKFTLKGDKEVSVKKKMLISQHQAIELKL